jgi:hypothetical protein
MTEELTQIESGDVLDVTLKTNGTEADGQLTVIDGGGIGPTKVENNSGDVFDLRIDRPEEREGVLGKHGNEVATVHNIQRS